MTIEPLIKRRSFPTDVGRDPIGGITGTTGGGPTDAATDRDGDTLYILSPSIGQIVAFHVGQDGSLTLLGAAAGAPAAAAGLAAR